MIAIDHHILKKTFLFLFNFYPNFRKSIIAASYLMFVNSVPLGIASLDTAVQALKGSAQSTVLIGVSKPLPVTESQMTENTSEEDSSNDNTEVRSAVSDMHTDPASGRVDRNDSISRYECRCRVYVGCR